MINLNYVKPTGVDTVLECVFDCSKLPQAHMTPFRIDVLNHFIEVCTWWDETFGEQYKEWVDLFEDPDDYPAHPPKLKQVCPTHVPYVLGTATIVPDFARATFLLPTSYEIHVEFDGATPAEVDAHQVHFKLKFSGAY
ncbi:hypothetical protein ACAX43_12365 [Paraburkholderia sp. IW21]|uniref:hypothetical protein n=1 Tax=Paraburkholderia sp. IW21 TaxID=3242488 RepID=UPI0035220D6C